VNSGYSGGAVRWAKTAGASATLRFTGFAVAWRGPMGPTRGKAKIYVNGTYRKTVDLHSSTFVASRVLYSATFSTNATRTLKIVVLGTSGRPVVAIDSFTIRRTVTTTSTNPPPSTTAYPVDATLRYLATPSLARPSYLSPLRDPTLGTTTTRISNTAGVRHAYSRISAWNSDGSKILLGFTYPGRMLDGRTYAYLGAFNQVSQAIWSNVNPNKLYGVSSNSNIFYSQNAATGALTVLHTFAGYSTTKVGIYGGISIGDGDGAVSDDDRYVALIGRIASGQPEHLIVYDIPNNTVVADIAAAGINSAQISRKGNYVVTIGSDTRVYPRDLSSSRRLYPYGNHGDNALDANGNEIYVSNNAPNVVAFSLATGAATRLLGGTTAFEYGHVSGRNIDRLGWIYLSVFDNSVTAGRPGHDQVIAVKTDGSGTVEVFGFSHHTNTTIYAMQPQAVPSPDGRHVIFASEWGSASVLAYVVGY
jgi:WD40 repeat protein